MSIAACSEACGASGLGAPAVGEPPLAAAAATLAATDVTAVGGTSSCGPMAIPMPRCAAAFDMAVSSSLRCGVVSSAMRPPPWCSANAPAQRRVSSPAAAVGLSMARTASMSL